MDIEGAEVGGAPDPPCVRQLPSHARPAIHLDAARTQLRSLGYDVGSSADFGQMFTWAVLSRQ
jgi:hypothetical protein